MNSSSTPVVFIINPVAGTGASAGIDRVIHEVMTAAGCPYELRYTQHEQDAYIQAQRAVEEGARLVVAVGGDGSVNQVAHALTGSGIPLGIVPVGSGNGLARYLGIPVHPGKAVRLLMTAEKRLVDTATVNGRFFVSIAGVGFDALVARKFALHKRRGFITYLRVVIAEYFTYRPKRYRLVLDGKTFRYRAFMITLANSNQFGYNTAIAPEARIDDGLIDVCIVGKPPWWKVPAAAWHLFRGKAGRIPFMEIVKASDIRIFRTRSRTVNLDGDPVKMDKDLHVVVKPLSLWVVTP